MKLYLEITLYFVYFTPFCFEKNDEFSAFEYILFYKKPGSFVGNAVIWNIFSLRNLKTYVFVNNGVYGKELRKVWTPFDDWKVEKKRQFELLNAPFC